MTLNIEAEAPIIDKAILMEAEAKYDNIEAFAFCPLSCASGLCVHSYCQASGKPRKQEVSRRAQFQNKYNRSKGGYKGQGKGHGAQKRYGSWGNQGRQQQQRRW